MKRARCVAQWLECVSIRKEGAGGKKERLEEERWGGAP